jgi:thiol-disulfide isomerase/thioredoxin
MTGGARVATGALLAVLAVLAGLGAWRLGGGGDQAAVDEPVHAGPAGISGGGDEPVVPQPPSRPIPETLPEIALPSIEGPVRRLADFRQPVLVVNFWATWCAPCRREIPLLRRIRDERGRDGVEVVGIAVDFHEDVQRYARDIGIDYPLLVGEQDGLQAVQAFGMDMVFPFTAFADAQRRIVALKVGELHADEAAFILDQVGRLNAGEGELEAVRRAIAIQLRILAQRRGSAGPAGRGTPATKY